ncbi:PTS transporter subunit EIIC [Ilyobacter polytropus]|uniref:PTS system IIB component, Glc family PTS system IIC component, Glc family n=1 Tax=Ilyobacter polytropus (strain ATCC 51220 / DSM 2926 / LMG 16218 / CuHBu1) TaxID=572544 RepID=E3HBB2_ILYPC|nr:PTS transporter subunit EIIC [Ilyobacter polytropus]ADO82263.1 PTS system IIB component, Glc family; PTS system IIC component, Glc family [Ilyobacter polytropus DSM 2926]
MKDKVMKYLQDFGRSLMLPIALLAAVGILFGFTAALSRPQIKDMLPFLNGGGVAYVLFLIRTMSIKIFGLIPVLFAISISLGLAKKEKEIAALAGFVCYYTLMWSSSYMVASNYISFPNSALGSALGLGGVPEMGAVGGMIAGTLTAYIHNKYYNINLPVAIAFFGGKRFVAIGVIIVGSILGQILPFIWLPISNTIQFVGIGISNLGLFGTFLYGFLERLLIPTGLHHILNGIFRTTAVGGELNGTVGVWNIFFEYFGKVDINELKEYTRFLSQGKIPYMVFGLPAAALAMYKTAPEGKKKTTEALLIAGVLASMTTGITEPLEFTFLFIAPLLFVFHSVMAGLSFLLMDLFSVGIGNTQGGLIDLLVYGTLVPGSNWIYPVIVGLGYSGIYYFTFKYYFTKKGIIIDSGVESTEKSSTNISESKDEKTALIIDGLGGDSNIVSVDNCFTRLRLEVKNSKDIDEVKLKSTGAAGIKIISETQVQVIYGPKVNIIASGVKDHLGY